MNFYLILILNFFEYIDFKFILMLVIFITKFIFKFKILYSQVITMPLVIFVNFIIILNFTF